MNFPRLIQLSLGALRSEDETTLSYVYGRMLNEASSAHIKNYAVIWTRGLFFQVLIFFRFLLIHANLFRKSQKNVQVVFYSGSTNQAKALTPALSALIGKGLSSAAFFESHAFPKQADSVDCRSLVRFSPGVILVALCLFVVRAPRLYFRLKRNGNSVGIKKFFHCFCESYAYIPYFINLLDEAKPDLVIQSNDHNTANRCLRLVAEMLSIKSVYLQHASVSNIFPPLEHSYAFLDGLDSMAKYIECQRAWASNDRGKVASSDVVVFLTGQQKNVATSLPDREYFCVGIGVNMMDELSHLEALLDVFDSKGVNCIVRTHPSQFTDFVSKLEKYVDKKKYVQLDKNNLSLPDFLSRCSILIAGNTSLHLEAAIAGLPTYYHEFGEGATQAPDYYGFVKAGLSTKLPADLNSMSIMEIMGLATFGEARSSAIRGFSESFGTQWQGHEGELVAETLCRVIHGRSLSDIYIENDKENCFKKVYRIAI